MSTSSLRPRSARAVTGTPVASSSRSTVAKVTSGVKRKQRLSTADEARADNLHKLLTTSKSKLTTMDIFEILSYGNFVSLSQESQEALTLLLPPTAFSSFSAALPAQHPASRSLESASSSESMDVDACAEKSPATLNPSLFSSAAFRAAATTFQDHLYSGWLTAASQAQIENFRRGTQEGTLHAQWKDEAWYEEALPQKQRSNLPHNDLANLAKMSLIQKGDLLVYRRTFGPLGITVEKDLLVRSVDFKSNALNLLLQPGSTQSLPSDLLGMVPSEPKPPTLTMESIMDSSELEEAVLGVDGRVTRADIYAAITSASRDPDTNAATHSARSAKAVTVWRWQEAMAGELEEQTARARGGRERLATVYFLRNV